MLREKESDSYRCEVESVKPAIEVSRIKPLGVFSDSELARSMLSIVGPPGSVAWSSSWPFDWARLPRATERELEDEFRVYGVLRSVWVARKPPGFAFVEFDDLMPRMPYVRRTVKTLGE
ncbi:hypothetical protein R1sor_023464 [Riccia sorocarpa]|uniref:RRM domain-containing protein n=1 Tax=Riccia sorocarpa TaxID=122646 RepID=A0ABD3GMQ3_9MARC